MVLDGTVQLGAGGRTRMTVRLLDARTGVQRWSDRHDGAVSDLFSFQISVARRLAERLRVELTMMSFEGTAPPEAIEGYLRARRDYRQLDTDAATSAFDGFERCVESAPGFLPAISAHAMAAARMWFFDRGIGGRRPWDVTARQSVARALAEAPDLPETHLAAAMLETQEVDFAAARRSLDRALSIAPTHVDTLEYLGMLLLEADLREEGVEKLELVLELDPARFNPLIYLARLRALDGDYEGALALHDKAEQLRVHPGIGTTIGPLRFAAWRADPASARLPERTIAHLRSPRWQLVQLYLSALRGEIGEAEAIQRTTFFVEAPQSARALSSVCQLLTEIWLLLGHPDRAFEMLDLASNNGLLDIAWIDRCPMLGPIRGQPGFPDVRSATLLRAAAMREA
jgi:serine/threonine-protein kinase